MDVKSNLRKNAGIRGDCRLDADGPVVDHVFLVDLPGVVRRLIRDADEVPDFVSMGQHQRDSYARGALYFLAPNDAGPG